MFFRKRSSGRIWIFIDCRLILNFGDFVFIIISDARRWWGWRHRRKSRRRRRR
jgi:hypothetical protein